MRGRLRYLHFRDHPPSALDQWCLTAAVMASTFAAVITALLPVFGKLPVLCVWGPSALLAVPWIVIWLGTRPGLHSVWQHLELPVSIRSMSRLAVFSLAVSLMYLVGNLPAGSRGDAMAITLLFFAQSVGLSTYRQDGSVVMTLLASCATGLLINGILDSVVGLIVFLISAWMSGTGLLWVHARATRRRLNFRLRLAPSREEGGNGLWSRAVLMAMLVPLLVVMTNISTRGVSTAGSWTWKTAGTAMGWIQAEVDQHSDGSRSGAQPGKGASNRRGGEEDRQGPPPDPTSFPSAPPGFPDELGFGRGLGTASRQDRLVVADPFAPGGRRRFHSGNPLYLTCSTYDRFTASGLSRSKREPALGYDDIGDGRDDGWTQVASLMAGMSRIELDIEFQPLLAPGGAQSGRLILPRLEPLLAVSLPKVRYSPIGMLTTIPQRPGPLRYAIRSHLQGIQGKDVDNDKLDLSLVAETRMPAGEPQWARVLELVRAEVKQIDLSAGPVRGVMNHFRNNYRYELAVGGSGPEALERFFRDRQGYCTYFATAAALCLRELGVPARIAAGYAVTRWDVENRVYLAGAEGAHAWTEVPVKGVGWVPVDATPAASLASAADWSAAAMAELYPGEELQQNVPAPGTEDDQLAIGADGNAAADLEETGASDNPILDIFAELNLFRAWQFWTLLGASILALTVMISKLARHHGWGKFGDADPTHPGHKPVRADAFRQLIRLLSKLGYPKHRSQTTLEFANKVVEHGGEDFDPLLDLTWWRYQEHYGGYPPAPEYEPELEDFMRQVKAMERGKE